MNEWTMSQVLRGYQKERSLQALLEEKKKEFIETCKNVDPRFHEAIRQGMQFSMDMEIWQGIGDFFFFSERANESR